MPAVVQACQCVVGCQAFELLIGGFQGLCALSDLLLQGLVQGFELLLAREQGACHGLDGLVELLHFP